MLLRILIIIFFYSAELVSAEYFSHLTNNIFPDIYNGLGVARDERADANGWNRIGRIYSDIFDLRMGKNSDIDSLTESIDEVIDEISSDRIKGLDGFEKEYITASLYGALAYINSKNVSYGMFSSVRKARNMFKEIEQKYDTADSEFGTAMTEMALGIYFRDSFWIKSVLGYKGNILIGLRKLDKISRTGIVSKVEASLFLIEYYSEILHDHASSIRYTKDLLDSHPDSKYFRHLYAKDLYHTGKIKPALEHFRYVNNNISEKFYPFEYTSIIYEAKCLYILNQTEAANEVLKYASKIHDGYILENFRNEWLNSVKIRQEAIFRAQYFGQTDLNLSADELKRTAYIYFDHGYFRELNRLIERTGAKEFEMHILYLKTKMIMGDWIKAKTILDRIVTSYKKDLKKYNDRKRFELLSNIVLSHTE